MLARKRAYWACLLLAVCGCRRPLAESGDNFDGLRWNGSLEARVSVSRQSFCSDYYGHLARFLTLSVHYRNVGKTDLLLVTGTDRVAEYRIHKIEGPDRMPGTLSVQNGDVFYEEIPPRPGPEEHRWLLRPGDWAESEVEWAMTDEDFHMGPAPYSLRYWIVVKVADVAASRDAVPDWVSLLSNSVIVGGRPSGSTSQCTPGFPGGH